MDSSGRRVYGGHCRRRSRCPGARFRLRSNRPHSSMSASASPKRPATRTPRRRAPDSRNQGELADPSPAGPRAYRGSPGIGEGGGTHARPDAGKEASTGWSGANDPGAGTTISSSRPHVAFPVSPSVFCRASVQDSLLIVSAVSTATVKRMAGTVSTGAVRDVTFHALRRAGSARPATLRRTAIAAKSTRGKETASRERLGTSRTRAATPACSSREAPSCSWAPSPSSYDHHDAECYERTRVRTARVGRFAPPARCLRANSDRCDRCERSEVPGPLARNREKQEKHDSQRCGGKIEQVVLLTTPPEEIRGDD